MHTLFRLSISTCCLLMLILPGQAFSQQALQDRAHFEFPNDHVDQVRIIHMENSGGAPEDIGKYTHLREISLWGNDFDYELEYLPSEICLLQELEEIEVTGTYLSALPPCMGDLPALRELHVWGNNLTDLPQELGQAKALRKLSIDTRVASLPAMPDLEELHIALMTDSGVPAPLMQSIEQLSGLRKLHLLTWSMHNEDLVTAFSEMLEHFDQLESLQLNVLVTRENFLRIAPYLKGKDVEIQNLEALPEDLKLLSGARSLKVRSVSHPETRQSLMALLPQTPTLTTWFQVRDSNFYRQADQLHLIISDRLSDPSLASSLLRSIPNLNSLTIYTNYFRGSLQGLDHLKELSIGNADGWSWEPFWKDVSILPELESLQISQSAADWYLHNTDKVASMPHLKRLEVISFPTNPYDVMSQKDYVALTRLFPGAEVIIRE